MKKSFAFDKRFIIWITAIVFCLLVIMTFSEDVNNSAPVIIAFIIAVGLFSLIEPNYYVADEEGIAIYFLFFKRYHYRWDEIQQIRTGIAGSWKDHYKAYFLIATNEKTSRFFTPGIITKSTATKRLIKMYWKDKIIGDEDIDYEKELEKQNRKLKASNEKLLVKAESEARTRIDEAIKVYKTKAKQQDKFIKTKYVYEIDSKECKDRPVCSYSFAVNIEVGKAGENASVFGVIKLLSVSRKEDKNKVNENKNAVSEIRKFLIDNIEK